MLLQSKAYMAAVALAATNSLIAVAAAAATCYDRAGNAQAVNILNGAFTPCRPDTTETHCCAADETCLSNGLCFVSIDSSLNTGTCADPTWKAPCFQFCNQYAFATVYRCGSNNWCCANGGNDTTCCQDGQEPFRVIQKGLVENGTAFVAGYEMAPIDAVRDTGTETCNNSSISNSDSTSISAGAQPSNTCAADLGSSNTLVVGLGAGLGVGVPLLAAVAALAVLLHRERRKSQAEAIQRILSASLGHDVDRQFPAQYSQSQGLKGGTSELGSQHRVELPGAFGNKEPNGYR